ncbi:sirohydrochlorin chelatase [Tessaracoccus rhinocerotis]|uniref:sirohydrochlorin chelatase n=1 Tax=Tessaracoccus rhinocerotis TaxID=1689449 RepID=UPI00163D5F8B|nr:CbiX/SirB N-terminal domain-containing protein [Tessaracoccus rhinocerotis]
MSRPPTLVIALHGTRRRRGTRFAEALRRAVASRLPGVPVELGFVDIHDELLGETVQRFERSVIVPAFLAAGYHVAHDIVEAVEHSGGRAVATQHVGPELVHAIADRLRAAGPPVDAVVLAAIGSRRLGATAEVLATANRLSRIVGRPVQAGFIFASEPSLPDAAAQLRAQGHRDLAVATHALGPGLYQDHIAALGLRVVAEPIGIHPRLLDAITSRYLAATGTTSQKVA